MGYALFVESCYWRRKAKKQRQFKASVDRLLMVIAFIIALVVIGGFVTRCVTSEDLAAADGLKDAHVQPTEVEQNRQLLYGG